MLSCWLALAMAGPPTALVGSWSFSGGDAQVKAVKDTKEAVAQTFNFAIRPIVRSKLAQPMSVDTGIRVEASDAGVTLHYEGDYPRKVSLTSQGEGYIDDKGTLTLQPEGDVWVLKGVGEDGGLVRRFQVSGDTLTLVSSIYSPQLEGKPSWTLTYSR